MSFDKALTYASVGRLLLGSLKKDKSRKFISHIGSSGRFSSIEENFLISAWLASLRAAE
jgi:hypothetical protein